MYGYVLQDWITIRGGAVADIIQGESTWMGFSSFQDLIIWLDVREIAGIDATHALTWYFETAPSKDNNLFTPMPTNSSGISLNTTNFTAGVQALTKVVLANASTTVPLATWVRWRLSPQAGITTPWDATFRVLCAANRVVREARAAW